ncbi:DUF523 domain-containing protein [Thermosulfuriphilus sp.]
MTNHRLRSSETFLVSACLLGVCCRYDGRSKKDLRLEALSRKLRLVPVCPEQLGGLSTPRCPAEIQGGDGLAVLLKRAKVVTRSGEDVTSAFIRGAEETVRLAEVFGARGAILKARSPSCGLDPLGVTTAALLRRGLKIYEF